MILTHLVFYRFLGGAGGEDVAPDFVPRLIYHYKHHF